MGIVFLAHASLLGAPYFLSAEKPHEKCHDRVVCFHMVKFLVPEYGMDMLWIWYGYDMDMVCIWICYVYGMYMVCVWYVYGMCMVRIWY